MMSEETPGGLHIDSDWKEEAAREKERLVEEEKVAPDKGGAPGEASFAELLNMLAMQAMIGLGGYQGPGGERIPPNPVSAKHFIDLLDVLEKKTKGNLDEDEQKAMDAVMYELRMQYVSAVSGGGAPPAQPTPGA
jgi:Domain of unknown function (DUF1844)